MLTDPLRPINHIFLDFENVHEIDLSTFDEKTVHFTLLVGAQQAGPDFSILARLAQKSAAVNLVKLARTGDNALDFALAYYVGRAAVTYPTAYYHIISKDKGYDAMVEHMRELNVQIRRHDSFDALKKCWKVIAEKEMNAHHELVPDAKRVLSKNRPSNLVKLTNYLRHHFKKPESVIRRLVRELENRGVFKIGKNEKIEYLR
ncbi:MAG: hypothetical protein CMO55_12660 [Verrucomicrobiales bacterium]|nr:hypothetical protein [Verrucomicrobiales bacterium]